MQGIVWKKAFYMRGKELFVSRSRKRRARKQKNKGAKSRHYLKNKVEYLTLTVQDEKIDKCNWKILCTMLK